MGFINIPDQFEHQKRSTAFMVEHDRVYDMSDAGCGKSRVCLDAIAERQAKGFGKALVLAPKAILKPAWGSDCERFQPNLRHSIATADNRAKAFAAEADIYITNHDAVKWIAKQGPRFLAGFDILIVDELTAFKHRTSQRSKALRQIAKRFNIRWGLSGTPNPNTILDIWHQVLVLDDGEHLGTSFWQFRQTVCSPRQVGPRPEHIEWADKPGAQEAVADILHDMSLRNKLEDCIDIPENSEETIQFTLSPRHMAAYKELAENALIELENGDSINAIHAGSLANKLLQMSSGAVYDENHIARLFATERYELVLELVQQSAEQSLVAFNWTHQRDELVKLAKKMKLPYAVIDGSTSDKERNKAVAHYQNGLLKVIFAHPMSAAHGLTLTKGTTTIWASPTYDAERASQFNRRIYRAGQTRKTRTLMIAAEDTIDEQVYERLQGKLTKMLDLLQLLNIGHKNRIAA